MCVIGGGLCTDEPPVKQGLLFLDFDGVMHPVGCEIDRYFCHLALLEAWLRRRPGVGVVISSSWREVHPVSEMQSYFAQDIGSRILGATPLIRRDRRAQYGAEPPVTRFEREVEITRWLHESGANGGSWAALDDQAWLFSPGNDRLVLCAGDVGLTQRELAEVEAILGTQG